MKTYSLGELTPFLIGKGTERSCYRSPENADRVVKLSRQEAFKQTRREIDYFHYLQQKRVPFTHIPPFREEVKVEGYIGFEQDLVKDAAGTVSVSLEDFWKNNPHVFAQHISEWLESLHAYLRLYNILPCDLNRNNILVQQLEKETRLVLIDGLGNANWIRIEQYIPFLGRRKIDHKWKKFIERDINPLLVQAGAQPL